MRFLEQYIEQLKETSLLDHFTKQDFQRLNYHAHRLETQVTAELFVTIKGMVVDIRERLAESPDAYIALLDEMQQLAPDDFNYEQVHFEPIEGDTRYYTHTLHFSLKDVTVHCEVKIDDNAKLATEKVMHTANWALAENEIDSRFQMIRALDDRGSAEAVGIIYLSPDQLQAILKQGLPLVTTHYRETQVTTRKTIAKWITDIQAVGLLDGISDEQITTIAQSLDPTNTEDAVGVLWKFPSAMVTFDSEYLSYGTLAERFTDLMSQIFTYVNEKLIVNQVLAGRNSATDETPYNHIILSLQVNGQAYDVILEDLGDWLDILTLMRFVNRILRDLGYEQHLYGVDSGDQGVIAIKQTASQYEALKNLNLFDVRPF